MANQGKLVRLDTPISKLEDGAGFTTAPIAEFVYSKNVTDESIPSSSPTSSSGPQIERVKVYNTKPPKRKSSS
jgi:hypothetical protein